MYKLYHLVSKLTESYYIGITGNSLKARMNGHLHTCRRGNSSHLYNCMRKYGDFEIVLVETFETREACEAAEIEAIAQARKNGHRLLNISAGGDGGFVVPDKEAWIKKLKKSRTGRKPSLGMTHTEENKKLFSEISKRYWATQKTYNAQEVCSVPFRIAKAKYGISKTHYHRLKKQLAKREMET